MRFTAEPKPDFAKVIIKDVTPGHLSQDHFKLEVVFPFKLINRSQEIAPAFLESLKKRFVLRALDFYF